jgi:hypothetical protein
MILGTRPAAEWRAYRGFIAAGMSDNEVTRAIRSDVPVVGSDAFAAAHRDQIERAHPTEVLRRDRTIGRPTLAELFADVSDKPTRNRRIRVARDRFHYRVSEIARHVALHYASVSRIATADRAALGGAQSERWDQSSGATRPLP